MNRESAKSIIQMMLTTTPPDFSESEVASLAAGHYGIHARVAPLVSERDQNFHLAAADGKRYTLKISNSAEQSEVVEFQNRALVHATAKDPSLPLPRVIPSLDGKLHSKVEKDGNRHFVRVLSWLDGVLLNDATVDADLAGRLGHLLARFGLALKDFDHPGSNPPSLWDMKRASGLRELLDYIEEPGLSRLAAETLDRFDSQLKPVLGRLRTQVIHNDMNPGNVLMDKEQPARISGLIDFGDMVKSPLIIDLAIAAAYQLSEGGDPLNGTLPMIAGYHAVRPLQDQEMKLLTDLIKTRLVTSLSIASYRVTLFPENRDYLMISYASARRFLIALNRQDSDDALQRIYSACACV